MSSSVKKAPAADPQKLMLNQVRHRILQYIHHHGNATVLEIGAALDDIPQATLYRQIKALSDGGLIRVSSRRRIRGTLEHTYVLDERLTGADGKELGEMEAQFALLGIVQDFADYYSGDSADAGRDQLSINSTPMMMSDEEFSQFMKDIEALTKEYLKKNKPGAGRRNRRVTLISSPA